MACGWCCRRLPQLSRPITSSLSVEWLLHLAHVETNFENTYDTCPMSLSFVILPTLIGQRSPTMLANWVAIFPVPDLVSRPRQKIAVGG